MCPTTDLCAKIEYGDLDRTDVRLNVFHQIFNAAILYTIQNAARHEPLSASVSLTSRSSLCWSVRRTRQA